MHSIVTTFRGAVIKVEVANFCAAIDTLIDQDVLKMAFYFLFQLILAFGNFMNSNKRGYALGFKLDSLAKVKIV